MSEESRSAASRGDTTREALIQAAIEIFGRDGFAAAGTRAISEAAGVNQALIGYHFGGKPGLYNAALKSIADSVMARMGPQVEVIEAALAEDANAGSESRNARPGGADAGRSLELLHGLTDAFVQMLTSDASSAWARLILREQQAPSEGFDILYQGVMHRVLDVTTRLVAHVRRRAEADEKCKLTALTILGQALVFRAARAAAMREMRWTRFTQTEIEIGRAHV